jgi:hypothetical protein
MIVIVSLSNCDKNKLEQCMLHVLCTLHAMLCILQAD